jgi:hypothetical protein
MELSQLFNQEKRAIDDAQTGFLFHPSAALHHLARADGCPRAANP